MSSAAFISKVQGDAVGKCHKLSLALCCNINMYLLRLPHFLINAVSVFLFLAWGVIEDDLYLRIGFDELLDSPRHSVFIPCLVI